MPYPATYADYPTVADLQTRLTDNKMSQLSTTSLSANLYRAIEEVETIIGRRALPVTTQFKLPCRGQRKQSLPASTLSVSSLTVLGTAYVGGVDYDLMSVDGNPPFDWIEFTNPLPASYESNGNQQARVGVVITASVGIGTSINADLWDAMVTLAIVHCMPNLACAISLGRAKIDMGQQSEYFSIRGDGGPYEIQAKRMLQDIIPTLRRYMRLTVGAG